MKPKTSQEVNDFVQWAKVAESKAKAAQAQLANMNAEIAAVVARRGQLTQDIEIEIEQTKKARRVELDEIEQTHRATMKEIDKDISVLQDAKGRLELASLGIEKDLRITRDELEHTKLNLDRYKGDVRTEAEALKALEATAGSLNHQIVQLTKQVAPLKQERTELTADLAALRNERTDLTIQVSRLTNELKALEIEGERRRQIIASKEAELKRQLEADRAYMLKMRDEMATRQLTLDEREKVLARREHKVRQNESEIARNSNLLNL